MRRDIVPRPRHDLPRRPPRSKTEAELGPVREDIASEGTKAPRGGWRPEPGSSTASALMCPIGNRSDMMIGSTVPHPRACCGAVDDRRHRYQVRWLAAWLTPGTNTQAAPRAASASAFGAGGVEGCPGRCDPRGRQRHRRKAASHPTGRYFRRKTELIVGRVRRFSFQQVNERAAPQVLSGAALCVRRLLSALHRTDSRAASGDVAHLRELPACRC